jgi:DNA-binding NtrC family response regulator
MRAAPHTTESRGQVLVVDDDPGAREVLVEALRLRKFEAEAQPSVGSAIRWLEEHLECDVVLTDLRMPSASGLELLRHALDQRPGLPVVVITAFGSIEAAVSAIRQGAYDFLTKPYDLDVVGLALDRAIAHRRLLAELERARSQSSSRFGEIIGASPAIERVMRELERFAETDATILIVGESGTGKELAAGAIHRASPRASGPFVAVNCGAIPEPLLESELFGHAKGAFTDARTARPGLFVRANGGTLFLDEIADMPLAMQVKLLRVLQERVVRAVGSDEEVAIDVRVIAATHRDLEVEVAEGRFRRDLLFRVQVIELTLPPLRARGHDVLLLAQHFVRQAAARVRREAPAISAEAAELLLAYTWPGNVRELANAVERAVALAGERPISARDLPTRVQGAKRSTALALADDPGDLVPLEEIERRYIVHVMEAVGGNKKLAAQVLQLDRSTLYRKLEQYGLHARSKPELG